MASLGHKKLKHTRYYSYDKTYKRSHTWLRLHCCNVGLLPEVRCRWCKFRWYIIIGNVGTVMSSTELIGSWTKWRKFHEPICKEFQWIIFCSNTIMIQLTARNRSQAFTWTNDDVVLVVDSEEIVNIFIVTNGIRHVQGSFQNKNTVLLRYGLLL